MVPNVMFGFAYGDAVSSLAGLSLRDLEYAHAVDRHRHFGRAASQCGVSQAALSEQLAKLEDRLGTRLFERAHRRVEPTPRGAPLLVQIARVLAEARGLLELSHEGTEGLAGKVRLGAIATLGPYYLPHLLRQVREAYPLLQLRLEEGQTDSLLRALRDGQVDAVLVAWPVPAEGLDAETLFMEPFLLVCPTAHRLADAALPGLSDLGGGDLLLLEEGHCLRDQALALCRPGPGLTRHATSVETLWQMIAADEGYSLLPALSAQGREAIAGLVRRRELAGDRVGRTIALVWRRTDPRGESFRGLATLLRDGAPAAVRPAETRLPG